MSSLTSNTLENAYARAKGIVGTPVALQTNYNKTKKALFKLTEAINKMITYKKIIILVEFQKITKALLEKERTRVVKKIINEDKDDEVDNEYEEKELKKSIYMLSKFDEWNDDIG
ncbi:2267_t:CDS:2, partial [Cetraspora pellucida]